MKKAISILTVALVMLCVFAFTANVALAADEITIIPVNYTEGIPLKVLANGESVGINSASILAYEMNFSMSPTVFELNLGGWKSDTGEIELRLDTLDGPVIGSIHTKEVFKGAWEIKSVLIQNSLEFKGKHKIWVTPRGGIHDLHYIKITVPSESDVYNDFATADIYTDIENCEIKNEINILAQLGAFDRSEKEFSPNGIAMRDDLVRGIAAFYNNLNIEANQTYFADVTAEHPNYKSYAKLVTMGLLTPDPDMKFNVNSSITLEEAVPMMLKLLNCEHLLKTGKSYAVVANELDLLDGIDCGYYAKMRRCDLAKLLYNAIDSQYLAFEYIKNNTVSYKKEYGILGVTGGLSEDVGTVTATSSNNLFSNTVNAPSGSVIIDDEVYLVGESSAASYLGFKCTYFYVDNGVSKEIVAIAPYRYSDYVQIFSKDVVFDEISDREISYFKENGRTEKFMNSGETIIMYNGRPVEDRLEDLINPEDFQGNIIMIDNEGSNEYDVVLVDSAETIIFGGISSEGVYDKLRGTHIPVDDIEKIRAFKNGSGYAFKDIAMDSVIDVYRSSNTSGDVLVRMYICDKETEGIVSSADKDYIYVDDTDKYIKYKDMTTPVNIGSLMKLRLNEFDAVVVAQPVSDSKVAIVLKKGMLLDNPLYRKAGVKLLTSDNELATFEFADRVYFDGYLCKDIDTLLAGNAEFTGLDNIEEETLIRYLLDKDGRIRMIDTPIIGNESANDTLTELMAESSNRSIPYKAIRVRDTQVDIVPIADNCKTAHLWASGEYEAYSFSEGAPTGSGEMHLAAYSTKADTMYADVVLWLNRAGGDNTAAFVYDKKISMLDDNGSEYVVIGGYMSDGYKEYKINTYAYQNIAGVKEAVDAMEPGDILSFALDANGEIYSNIVFIMFADGSESRLTAPGIVPQMHDTMQAPPYTNDNKYGIRCAGTIIDRDGDYVKIERTHGDVVSQQVINLADLSIIEFDKAAERQPFIEKFSTGLVGIGQKVAVFSSPWSVKMNFMIVYK